MNHIISKMLMYGSMPEDAILMRLGAIFKRFGELRAWESQQKEMSDADIQKRETMKNDLRLEVFRQIKRIMEVATQYGFDHNLWHNYLTFVIITNENPFSITCEKVGASDGSVNYFAQKDFHAFRELFAFDFSEIEQELGVDCFSHISRYQSIGKSEFMYNANVSEKVQALSAKLEEARDDVAFFDLVTGFYKDYGVGMFGLNKAFRIKENSNGDVGIIPINNMDKVMLDDLIGYEIQKKKLVDNTEAFVDGRKANNVLLFGDSGTGKSTSIKAIVNEFYDQGLRMIEIYKHQFKDLSNIIGQIKNRNYKFIIYMDDLSFEEFEVEYKFLKAVIEGGVETRPENILIYATSNRRHLIKETWKDRSDVEVDNGMHKSDTMEEKLSLANRFGVTINFSKPSQKEYFHIVVELAKKNHITMPEEDLRKEANKWELSHGGISGRTAQQFINYVQGTMEMQ